MARRFNPFCESDKLTTQQTEVARRMALGESTLEIAHEMKLSPKTVEYHRAEIYKRIGVQCAVGLTHWALATGLVENKFAPLVITAGEEVLTADELMPAPRPEWTKTFGRPICGGAVVPRVTHGINRHGKAL